MRCRLLPRPLHGGRTRLRGAGPRRGIELPRCGRRRCPPTHRVPRGAGRRRRALAASTEPSRGRTDPRRRRDPGLRGPRRRDHRLRLTLVRNAPLPHRSAAGHDDAPMGAHPVSAHRGTRRPRGACQRDPAGHGRQPRRRSRGPRRPHLRTDDADLRRGGRPAPPGHHPLATAHAASVLALGGTRHATPAEGGPPAGRLVEA